VSASLEQIPILVKSAYNCSLGDAHVVNLEPSQTNVDKQIFRSTNSGSLLIFHTVCQRYLYECTRVHIHSDLISLSVAILTKTTLVNTSHRVIPGDLRLLAAVLVGGEVVTGQKTRVYGTRQGFVRIGSGLGRVSG
jgi:uncharacterized membrane protein